ncbi:MAG: hypothetical protein V4613_14210 [Bacteroidota bacterium]
MSILLAVALFSCNTKGTKAQRIQSEISKRLSQGNWHVVNQDTNRQLTIHNADHESKYKIKLSEKIATKQFDIARYIKLKSKNLEKYFLNDSTFVELSENNQFYIEIIKNINTNFEKQIFYNKITRNIEKEGNFLCNLPIEIHKKYNIKGQIEKVIDYEEHFKISVKDLSKIIFNEMQVDIMRTKNYCAIFRGGKPPSYYYQAMVETGLQTKKVLYLKIDGTTGEILIKSYKTQVP